MEPYDDDYADYQFWKLCQRVGFAIGRDLLEHERQIVQATVTIVKKEIQYQELAVKYAIQPPQGFGSGLPAAQQVVKKPKPKPFSKSKPKPQKLSEPEAFAELLKAVEENAERLRHEETAKELGMSIDEARKKYPGIFGPQDSGQEN